jgi:hypothetical protein
MAETRIREKDEGLTKLKKNRPFNVSISDLRAFINVTEEAEARMTPASGRRDGDYDYNSSAAAAAAAELEWKRGLVREARKLSEGYGTSASKRTCHGQAIEKLKPSVSWRLRLAERSARSMRIRTSACC